MLQLTNSFNAKHIHIYPPKFHQNVLNQNMFSEFLKAGNPTSQDLHHWEPTTSPGRPCWSLRQWDHCPGDSPHQCHPGCSSCPGHGFSVENRVRQPEMWAVFGWFLCPYVPIFLKSNPLLFQGLARVLIKLSAIWDADMSRRKLHRIPLCLTGWESWLWKSELSVLSLRTGQTMSFYLQI